MAFLLERRFDVWLEQLESIEALPENWDSYGASRIASTAVAAARALLTELAARSATKLRPFHLAPIPTGGVQLEWKRPDSAALELWIDAEGQIDAVFDLPAAEPRITEKHLTTLPDAVAEIEAFVA